MKTIEEITSDIAKGFITENRAIVGNDAPLVHDVVDYTVNHIMSLPLAERLTAEEMEKIKRTYKRMVVDVENSDSYDCVAASDLDIAMESLEDIFGKAMFEEKGGENDN